MDLKKKEKSDEEEHLNTNEYKETGVNQSGIKRLTILDLLYSTIIGVLGGIISSIIPFGLLIKIWYPLYGGTQLVSGHHVIWATIVYGLTRKKEAILITMLSKGVIEFMFGDLYAVLIIFVNFMEAVCLIGGFLLMKRLGEADTKLGWGIAGGIGNFFQAPFIWIINARWYFPWYLWALAFIFAFVSGVLITGLLGRTVKTYLIRAGVPTTF